MPHQLLQDLKGGNVKALARAVSLIEAEAEGYEVLLQSLPLNNSARIIGITGPPGAGKSTVVDALIGELVKDEKKVAVLCVDPSSPFNLGALLGDRIRMSGWYTNPKVFIRSLATRGSMGGLHPKMIEITDLAKAAGYDYIIVETVGVGQSEIEITGLADITVVVLVPEAGDEVQTMKAGLMEIADVFVVNKADRPGADAFVKNLRQMLAPAFRNHVTEIPIIKAIASQKSGISELASVIKEHNPSAFTERKTWLLAQKAWHLIVASRMKDTSLQTLIGEIEKEPSFNLYAFVKRFGP